MANIRLKNKREERRFNSYLKKANDEITQWINANITEELKQKCANIQSRLLEWFRKHKRPESTKVQTFLNALKEKYLEESYPRVKFILEIGNPLEFGYAAHFNIYLSFNNYWNRFVIMGNKRPTLLGKPYILNIEPTEEEIEIAVETKAIKDGNFEEI
jgi:hypothetical protein